MPASTVVFLAALALVAKAAVPKPAAGTLKVFVFAGQSNSKTVLPSTGMGKRGREWHGGSQGGRRTAIHGVLPCHDWQVGPVAWFPLDHAPVSHRTVEAARLDGRVPSLHALLRAV